MVIPLVFIARLTRRGIRTIGEVGFREKGDEAYADWLGKRYKGEMWGEMFTNAMVMGVKLVLGLVEQGVEEEEERVVGSW